MRNMKLTLGFSTCPNDTFIFDAIVHHKIDLQDIEFEIHMADVEELNRLSFENVLDITKLSFNAYAYVSSDYQVLDSGSALGKKNGPLLISKYKIYPDEIDNLNIAIPGEYTTANLLLSIAFPKATFKKSYLFSDIEDAVCDGEVDAGLIIHENRFTYHKKGLLKIIDFGEYWENNVGKPIPLGGIVVRRALPRDVKEKINRILYQSVAFAMKNPRESHDFVKQYAQEMDEAVMQGHINTYINDFTLRLGTEGREAIGVLYERAFAAKAINKVPREIFII